MGEFLALFQEMKGVFGGTAAIGIALAIYLWSQKGQRQLENANAEGNVSAITHWQEVVRRADAALAAMTERADKFAEERNEAYRELAKMEGRIEQLTKQIEAQTELIGELRQRVLELEGQPNGVRGN